MHLNATLKDTRQDGFSEFAIDIVDISASR